LRDAGVGAVAGALGTLALNVSTYVDIATRGRPPSSVPAKAAGTFADRAGVDLGDEEKAEHRRTGLGALMGYATGIAAGVVFGLVRGTRRETSTALAGLAAGAAVMAASDTSSVLAGATDPRTWGMSGWLSDIVPHAVYGLVTAAAFDRLS
jgi:hypothetical protein